MVKGFKIIATSPFVANHVRRWTRWIGLNQLITRLLWKGYEERFSRELLARITEGDCVWDVGANIGFYTEKFSDKAARVVAFEPVQSCFDELVRRSQTLAKVTPVRVAMGSTDGMAAMELGNAPFSTTGHISLDNQEQRAAESCQVEVRSAESFVAEHPDLFPNVIKVDVEGYEWAVFEGMRGLLGEARLKCVAFEVHFRILEERRESRRPREIQLELEHRGFQITWTDASHLVAAR